MLCQRITFEFRHLPVLVDERLRRINESIPGLKFSYFAERNKHQRKRNQQIVRTQTAVGGGRGGGGGSFVAAPAK